MSVCYYHLNLLRDYKSENDAFSTSLVVGTHAVYSTILTNEYLYYSVCLVTVCMSELMHSVLIIVVFDPVVGWNDLAMSYSLNVKSVTDHFNVLGLNFTADIMDCFDSYI